MYLGEDVFSFVMQKKVLYYCQVHTYVQPCNMLQLWRHGGLFEYTDRAASWPPFSPAPKRPPVGRTRTDRPSAEREKTARRQNKPVRPSMCPNPNNPNPDRASCLIMLRSTCIRRPCSSPSPSPLPPPLSLSFGPCMFQ